MKKLVLLLMIWSHASCLAEFGMWMIVLSKRTRVIGCCFFNCNSCENMTRIIRTSIYKSWTLCSGNWRTLQQTISLLGDPFQGANYDTYRAMFADCLAEVSD